MDTSSLMEQILSKDNLNAASPRSAEEIADEMLAIMRWKKAE